MKYFKSDISDVVERVKEVLLDRSESPIEYHENNAEAMQEFSRIHLTHFGVARAMAYALTVYAHKITWKPKMEDGFVDVLEGKKGHRNPSLPVEFVKRLLSTEYKS